MSILEVVFAQLLIPEDARARCRRFSRSLAGLALEKSALRNGNGHGNGRRVNLLYIYNSLLSKSNKFRGDDVPSRPSREGKGREESEILYDYTYARKSAT